MDIHSKISQTNNKNIELEFVDNDIHLKDIANKIKDIICVKDKNVEYSIYNKDVMLDYNRSTISIYKIIKIGARDCIKSAFFDIKCSNYYLTLITVNNYFFSKKNLDYEFPSSFHFLARKCNYIECIFQNLTVIMSVLNTL